MRRITRTLAQLTLLGVIASVLTVVPTGTASAAESIPTLQYPAVDVGRTTGLVSSPTSSVTLPCNTLDTGMDLVTYSSAGAVTRQLNRTQYVDGITNCITSPVVDKNDVIYGIPFGHASGSTSYDWGPNLLAYSGNTLKWKYPAKCGSSSTPVTVGADGNIYTATYLPDGVHLIGLAPELAAGQTQPTKVLDVKIANDCGVQFFPYRDGLLLRGQNSGFKYYSYAGKLLGTPTVSNFSYSKMNANGRLFDFRYVSGSFTSLSVSAYEPSGATVWTTSASTSGANVQGAEVYPLPGGGVVALIRQQKMVSPGIPWTPTQYVYVLVTLNAAGQQVGTTVELPNSNPQGTLGNIYANPTNDGKLSMVRDFQMNTGLSYPTQVSALAIGVFDPVTGGWSYQQVMSGDPNKPGGPYGYYLDYSKLATTTNTLNFIAKCSGNCGSIGRKLYAVQVSGLGMDYPRGEVLTRSPRPSASYVALGDSFSSGEGVPPFETGTAIPGVNTCHRSTVAYPRLIAGSSPNIPLLGTGGFRACSGAVTTNVTDLAQWNEGIQLDWWPNATTQLVTLTIGGNDIGFATFAKACVFPSSSCDVGTTAYNDTLNKLNNELPNKLKATYRRTLQYAPNAEIYVVGYPYVVANKSVNDPADSRCFYMQGGSSNWAEARAARAIVTKLNEKIVGAVTDVQVENTDNLRLHYVDVNASGSPFVGHEVCGTAPASWFQNIDQATGDPAYVFHPNSSGQEGYATVIGTAINAG